MMKRFHRPDNNFNVCVSQRKENDVEPQASSEGECFSSASKCRRKMLILHYKYVLFFFFFFFSLQSLMLQIAASWIEQEKKDIAVAKEAYMAENCPNPDLSGDQAALMVRRQR